MAAIPGVPPSAHDPPAPQTQSSPACRMAREEPRVELGGGGGGGDKAKLFWEVCFPTHRASPSSNTSEEGKPH